MECQPGLFLGFSFVVHAPTHGACTGALLINDANIYIYVYTCKSLSGFKNILCVFFFFLYVLKHVGYLHAHSVSEIHRHAPCSLAPPKCSDLNGRAGCAYRSSARFDRTVHSERRLSSCMSHMCNPSRFLQRLLHTLSGFFVRLVATEVIRPIRSRWL